MTPLSPQIRLVAVIGIVAALAFAGGMFMLGRGGEEAEGVEPVAAALLPKPKPAPAGAPAAEPAAAADPVVAQPAAQTPAKPAPAAAAAKPKPTPVTAPNGLPWAVHAELQRSDVVVVALYAPDARVDALAVPEARAGAEEAGAGFVTLNVLDERQGGPLARLLGIVKPPSVLVYAHPDTLFVRLDGFADADTVAQAAHNARP